MAGVINRVVGASGVIAFQDRENPEKFEYFPSTDCTLLGKYSNFSGFSLS